MRKVPQGWPERAVSVEPRVAFLWKKSSQACGLKGILPGFGAAWGSGVVRVSELVSLFTAASKAGPAAGLETGGRETRRECPCVLPSHESRLHFPSRLAPRLSLVGIDLSRAWAGADDGGRRSRAGSCVSVPVYLLGSVFLLLIF